MVLNEPQEGRTAATKVTRLMSPMVLPDRLDTNASFLTL